MRILVSSNGMHTHTGYGTQGKGLASFLRSEGHDVAYHAWYGVQGGVVDIDGIRNYPAIKHLYGGDGALIVKDFEADIVISLQDIWPLPADFAASLPVPWLAWFPIDGEPLSPAVKQQAMTAAYPVVYSRFGQEVFKRDGVEVDYIPLAYDDKVFYPGDKATAREQAGFEHDKFIVAMVAANKGYPCRKSFPEAIAGFAKFHKQHPNSLLYLHTERFPQGEGVNVQDIMRLCGLKGDEVIFVDQAKYALGLPDEYLANIYRAIDVLLAPSMGEGFGLPIVEAQACGCPVITQDVTSMSEVTRYGATIKPLQVSYSPLGQWQYVASIDRIADALTYTAKAYESGEYNDEAADGAAYEIKHDYSWGNVSKRFWRPYLHQIAQDMGKPYITDKGRANGHNEPKETRDPYLTREDLAGVLS